VGTASVERYVARISERYTSHGQQSSRGWCRRPDCGLAVMLRAPATRGARPSPRCLRGRWRVAAGCFPVWLPGTPQCHFFRERRPRKEEGANSGGLRINAIDRALSHNRL